MDKETAQRLFDDWDKSALSKDFSPSKEPKYCFSQPQLFDLVAFIFGTATQALSKDKGKTDA
jgi:hypothetical protein|tara:strand:- start:424 stop:609 length:186 start_codon:yes stop_codon:yes gene_type:complete